MLLKVTAIGNQNNVSTIYFDKPTPALVNIYKIWTIMGGKKGTEIKDESGKNTLIVQETPEEINEMLSNM